MCGIFAYKGDKEASSFLLEGLKNLEYRGYDSAGICEINNSGEFFLEKAVGKVSNLASKVENLGKDLTGFNTGIAHTRWATHGKVTLENTHPHYSKNERFFIVHNGIIENYIELKKELEEKGYTFYGETDTEIVAKLIEELFEIDLETTIKKVFKKVTGAYAMAVIDRENPNNLIGVKIGSPLVLGISENEFFLSSDANALARFVKNYVNLDDGEMVVIKGDNYKIISLDSGLSLEKQSESITYNEDNYSLGDFTHFMEKEIFQVPEIIDNFIKGRIDFESLEIKSNTLEELAAKDFKRIEIIASGTSYNAGMTASYLFEELASIPTTVYVSTEFKYKKKFINPETLYIFISQSGETADSLESLKVVKNKGGFTFGIVNVVGSSIARLSDLGLYTHSGREVGVAATKSFIGQIGVLLIMALYLGNKKDLEYTKYKEIISSMKHLRDDVSMVLLNSNKIEEIAKKYAHYKDLFFLGRNIHYPMAMEGSLKCKEITYNHTEAYSAGELKHGPLSLIEDSFPTILINPEGKLKEKNISTLKEVKARDGKVVGIITKGDENKNLYDDVIEIPQTIEELSIFPVSVALQLFAYYMAKELKREIDKPRNLAKSVTVE
ncbi:MAG: glutamine--fructose-6-phosphate transaminase (isomerizing) [Candidatus Gracilibacteria bacterium]|nr:glutamine--fructose-6-phosphate transaminase (isomerizing) [Candidatus Gracilibacteria bacterium]